MKASLAGQLYGVSANVACGPMDEYDSEWKFVSTRYSRMRSSPGTQEPRLRSE